MSDRSTPTTPSAKDRNRFSFADMLELRDWAAAAVAKGWACEAQADPRRGQLKRVGSLPGGREFVTISVTGARSRRHVRIERCDGLWIVRPVWTRRATVFLRFCQVSGPLGASTLGLWRPPFRQFPEYRAQWRSGAYGDSAVWRQEHVRTCGVESGGSSGVRRDRGNIVSLMRHS